MGGDDDDDDEDTDEDADGPEEPVDFEGTLMSIRKRCLIRNHKILSFPNTK